MGGGNYPFTALFPTIT